MKRTIEVTETRKIVTGEVCDMCGSEYWSRSGISVNEATVELRRGNSFIGGGFNIDVTTVDLCVPCFEGKLLPWLATQGVKPTKTNESN